MRQRQYSDKLSKFLAKVGPKERDIDVAHFSYGPKVRVNAVSPNDLPQKMHVFLNALQVTPQLPLDLDYYGLFFSKFQVVNHQPLQQFNQVRVHMFGLGIEFCPFTPCLPRLLINLQREVEQHLKNLLLLGEVPLLSNITVFILLIVGTQRYHLVQPAHDHEVAFALFKGLIQQSACRLEAGLVQSSTEINDKLLLYFRGAEYFLSLAFAQTIFFEYRLVVRIEFAEVIILEFLEQLLGPLVMQVG